MDGLEQRINAILSDPESMKQIMQMAQTLGLSPPEAAQKPADEPQASGAPLQPQLASLLTTMSGPISDDRQTALLKALRPFLRADRQARLDHALQAARMIKVAKTAMSNFPMGGQPHV